MDPKKAPASPRLVWRMSADAPMGEYLELVPKSAYETEGSAPAPKRVLHPEIRDPIYRTPLQASSAEGAANHSPISASGPSLLERRTVPRAPMAAPASIPASASASATTATAREAPAESTEAPAVRTRVLNPGKVPSWRASSYDLLTGCTVSDVTDTIPGEIFEELFSSYVTARPVRRRR